MGLCYVYCNLFGVGVVGVVFCYVDCFVCGGVFVDVDEDVFLCGSGFCDGICGYVFV